MKKSSLIAISIISVVLLVTGSLTNVVGYKVVQSSNQKIINDEINQKESLFQTILDIANNKEIQSIIQKSEIKGSPIRLQQLLGRLQKEIIGAVEKNDLLNDRIKKLSDSPCDCEKNNTNRLWHFPVICILLFPLFILAFGIAIRYNHYYLLIIIGTIGWNLDCFWAFLPPYK